MAFRSLLLGVAVSFVVGSPLGGVEHRPQYHLISQGAQAGWLSDPNGPIFYRGRYHMFYQAATSAQMRAHNVPYHTPDPISWGHMSSGDLVHWVQHPIAISPAAADSFEGADVYSGAMIEDPTDGSVISFFACACGPAKPPGGHNDAVCYARSIDSNLTSFTKYNGTHGSVLLYVPLAMGEAAAKQYLPVAGSQFVFRNSTDGSWLMAVGSKKIATGEMAVLLFAAADLQPSTIWRYVRPLFSGGGVLQGGAWCPYFASLGGGGEGNDSVMLAMNDFVGRGQLSAPDYSFRPATSSPFERLDHGLAHVSAVFVGPEPKNRSIVMRWLIGAPSCATLPGRMLQSCDPKHADDVQNAWGWVGVHSLPVVMGAADSSAAVQNTQGLTYRVVEEVDSLRVAHTHRVTAAASSAHSGPLWHQAVTGVALELRLNVSLAESSSDACAGGLIVRANADGSEQTTIAIIRARDSVSLIVNRTLSSLAANVSSPDKVQVQQLPVTMLGKTTELAVYIDHSVLEVFVGDFAIMSTRVYPGAGNAADRVATFVQPGCAQALSLGELSSWVMKDVYAN